MPHWLKTIGAGYPAAAPLIRIDLRVFKEIITDYSSRLNLLRDFVAYVGPLLRKRAEDVKGANKSVLGQNLADIVTLLAKPGVDLSEALKGKKISLKIGSSARAPKTGKSSDANKTNARSILRSIDSLDLVESRKFLELAQKLQATLQTVALPNVQVSHLYESSLISLISTTEWFEARILHAIFEKFPGRLDSDKLFTVSQLKALGSVDKVFEEATDAKIESILQKKFEEQVSYLKKAFGKVDFAFINSSFADIVETHARRNLFIHNGGLVNQRYLDRISAAGVRENVPNIGERLIVTEDYLERAINIFEAVFVLIAMAIWKHLDSKDRGRGFLTNAVLEQIEAKRYRTARAWSDFTMRDTALLKAAKLGAKFNYWQTYKWEGRFEEVKADVEREDLSAGSSEFRLAKYALLDQLSEFFELLPRVLESKKISLSDLKSWPIFQGVRQDNRYKAALERFGGEVASAGGQQLPASPERLDQANAVPLSSGKKSGSAARKKIPRRQRRRR